MALPPRLKRRKCRQGRVPCPIRCPSESTYDLLSFDLIVPLLQNFHLFVLWPSFAPQRYSGGSISLRAHAKKEPRVTRWIGRGTGPGVATTQVCLAEPY